MSVTYRRAPAAIWRSSARLLVAALPPNAPTRMTGSAALVWGHMELPVKLDDLVALLVDETGGDAGVIRADVQSLLDRLLPLGLVERLA